jgi:hypothetical protein
MSPRALRLKTVAVYRRSSNDADPASLLSLTVCLLPFTATLIVPETPYSLLWKLPL